MKNYSPLYLGYVIPFVFWITTIICGALNPHYDHAEKMVSELGEQGTDTQYIFTFGLVLCSILSILFIIALYRKAKQFHLHTVPIFLLFCFSFSIAGAGLFPYPTKLHTQLGMPSVFLFMSPLSVLILWRNSFKKSRMPAFVSFLIMSAGFMIYIPHFLEYYFGLKQRFFHLGWTIWFCCLSYLFLKNLAKSDEHQIAAR